MIDEHDLNKAATFIATAVNAERVILFGSHARGEANENSDVDFMIIAESNLPGFKRSRELYKLLRPYPFGMDLIVFTPLDTNAEQLRDALSILMPYAVEIRYPDDWFTPSEQDTKEARDAVSKV